MRAVVFHKPTKATASGAQGSADVPQLSSPISGWLAVEQQLQAAFCAIFLLDPPPPSMPARASLADRERRAVPAPSLSWLRMRRRWLPPRRGVIAVRPPSSLSPAATRPRPGRVDRRDDGLRSPSDIPSLVRAVALRPALLPKLFSYAL